MVGAPFWSLSCTLLARHLCHLFCYQVSCFRRCLHYVQYSPRSQGTENLDPDFPGYVRRKLLGMLLAFNSLAMRQKGESQNGCYKKTKQAKFYEKGTFLSLIRTRKCAYQGVRNVPFSENLT